MLDLEVAVAAARAGGEIVSSGFGRHTTTEFKGRSDPVTEIDRNAEAAVLEVLRDHRPDDAVLGEEGTDIAASSGDRRWLIDPLDGTVNFVHGLPQVSVSIGLYDGSRPLAAAVLDPISGELFTATIGGGAHLGTTPLSVSETPDLASALLATGFPYDRNDHADAYLPMLGSALRNAAGVRRLGSAALDLCWLAAGRYDGYWEYSLKPWDIAAGLIILTEAGGTATTPDGDPMTPFSRHIVATNSNFQEPLRTLVAAGFPAHLK